MGSPLDKFNKKGNVNDYPTMHYFGIPRHIQSSVAYKILNEYFWNSSEILNCGNVIDMSYCTLQIVLFIDVCIIL